MMAPFTEIVKAVGDIARGWRLILISSIGEIFYAFIRRREVLLGSRVKGKNQAADTRLRGTSVRPDGVQSHKIQGSCFRKEWRRRGPGLSLETP